MITITLPWPHKHLSPNSRPHWRQKAKAAKAARNEAMLLTAAAAGWRRLLCQDGLRVHYSFHPSTVRRRDLDNLIASHKAANDGIAHALNVDDSTFRLSYAMGEIRKPACVVVTVSTPEEALRAVGVIQDEAIA